MRKENIITFLKNCYRFKELLQNSLREHLKEQMVEWHNYDKLYFFKPLKPDDDKRKVEWVGKVKATRTVFEIVKNKKDPTKISHFKHLSFTTQFRQFGSKWVCILRPNWFYTSNGFRKHYYHKDLLSRQKRLEFNQTVRNLVRFLAYILADATKENKSGFKVGSIIELECHDTLVTAPLSTLGDTADVIDVELEPEESA